VEGLARGYGKLEVIPPFDALVARGEKICVIGKNGAGKSTLVKTLVGELPPTHGTARWGHQAQVGYLPQDQQGVIRPGTTCFGWLRELDDKLSNEEISGLLGRMLFSGEERMKPTATLSGGETVRLLMARLMMEKPNVLVLDEPTNHLDLQAIAALSEGLARYEGTVIVVTHDQQLVAEVGTRIWHVRRGEPVHDFPGTFDEFLEKHPDLAAQHR
jgi:ATPase subunit of ABC transporter with duplicated ATPase domains